MHIPVIIDTDFGGDPDDSIALFYAIHSPRLKIQAIITNDEYKQNYRACVLYKWLKSINKNIPVFSGKDLGNRNLFLLEKFYENTDHVSSLFTPTTLQTYLDYLSKNKGVYISIGGLSNLNFLYQKYPDYLKKINIYVMGGAINYRKPGIAEHNIRLDIDSARNIFYSSLQSSWVLSDHTFVPQTNISSKHKLYKQISSRDTFFYQVIKENMDKFFQNKYPDSYLHDPITISSLILPIIQFKKERISFTENGEFKISSMGKLTNMSDKINYELFWKDIFTKLNTAKIQ